MQVTVKTFAHLREELGFAERTLELEEGARVIDAWRAVAGHGELPAHVLAAVNLDYAAGDRGLSPGDEVAFFPPVTGGGGR